MGNEMKNKFFLASFPRSGNTWVRFLIGNMYNQVEKRFPEIDFHNVHGIVPEYGTVEPPGFEDFPRVYKTHNPYQPDFESALLLLRNPFDALCSYFDLLIRNRKKNFSLEEMTKNPRYGISAILRHTESYIANCRNLRIFTYEKMQADTTGECRKIADFIGFDISPADIEEAVRKSSFNVMEQIENQKGRKFGSPDLKFIRKGLIGQGVEEIKKQEELYRYVMEELKKSPVLYLLYS